MLRLETSDDRGQVAPIAWSGLRWAAQDALQRARLERPAAHAGNTRAALRIAWRTLSNRNVIAAAMALALIAIIVSMLITSGPIGLGLLVMTPVAAPLLLTALRGGRAALEAPDAVADACERAAFRRGRCPGCHYTLIELATEADGTVVCPECGAAWAARSVHERTREREVILG